MAPYHHLRLIWLGYVCGLVNRNPTLRTLSQGLAQEVVCSNPNVGWVDLFVYHSWRSFGSLVVSTLPSHLLCNCGFTGSFKLQMSLTCRSLEYTRSWSKQRCCIKFSLLCEYLIMILVTEPAQVVCSKTSSILCAYFSQSSINCTGF